MSDVAAVLHCGLNAITFAVDDVTLTDTRFPTQSVWTRVEKLTDQALLAASHESNFLVVEDRGHHALISAVHLAFSRHLPLSLTPDVIWLTIAQGFAQHVNNHAEELRSLLVRHEGKRELWATLPDLPERARREDWANVVDQWAGQIETEIPQTLRHTLECDFSTTTPIIRTASQVAMLDAFQPYYDYISYCICGIPSITLYGTVEDWRAIRARVERLSAYRLEWWTDCLLPLCDAFIATAEGQPSREFWQEIYKPRAAYGENTITGWITDLFPYLLNRDRVPTEPNHMLKEPHPRHYPEPDPQEDFFGQGYGLTASDFPNGLSNAPAILILPNEDRSAETRIGLEFLGGFFGVTQDPEIGCVAAEIGWGVQKRDALEEMLEKLEREHALLPPGDKVVGKDGHVYEAGIPREIFRLLDHCDGGVLFADTATPWRLRFAREYAGCDIVGYGACNCFLDLADGRSIGFLTAPKSKNRSSHWRRPLEDWWIVVGHPEPAKDIFAEPGEVFQKETTVVIATSLLQFFERILQAEGRYYFDSLDFVPVVPALTRRYEMEEEEDD